MKQPASFNRHQSGSILLEGLIAVLLFSIGILAIVGMQASAVKAASDAKYRSDASMLVNRLIGEMWAGDRTPATLVANYQGGAGTNGTNYQAWLSDVQTVLPGATGNPPLVTVTVQPGALASSAATAQVSVTVWWLAPSDPVGATPHQYSVVTLIGG